jgi:VanZ family protein
MRCRPPPSPVHTPRPLARPSFRPVRALSVSLGLYLAALVYATLYPWRGWKFIGWTGLQFMVEPWPRYWTWFDVCSNVAVYIPAGALIARVIRRRLPAMAAACTALVLGGALSFVLEALQSFLPERVPSRLDWMANTAGVALGALLAAPVKWPSAGTAIAYRHRNGLVRPGTAMIVGLICTWVALPLYPQRLLFGAGDILGPLAQWVDAMADPSVLGGSALPASARGASAASGGLAALHVPDAYALIAEAGVVASSIVAVGLLVAEALQQPSQRGAITAAVILAGLGARLLASSWRLDEGFGFAWLTAGTQAGLVLGIVMLALIAPERQRSRLWTAVGALGTCAVLSNLYRVSAYEAAMAGAANGGALRNFNGLLHAVALLWPYVALAVVLLRLRAGSKSNGL